LPAWESGVELKTGNIAFPSISSGNGNYGNCAIRFSTRREWSTSGNGYPETPEGPHTWVSHKIHCPVSPQASILGLEFGLPVIWHGVSRFFAILQASKELDTYLHLNPTSGPTGNLTYIVHSLLPIYIVRGRYLRIT
jgi:hypothetical protein